MFKANNNHFIGRSKIKILKIRPFYTLKSAKIVKKMWKNIFSINFGIYDMHKTHKYIHQMKDEIERYQLQYIFSYFANITLFKFIAE